MRRRLFIPLCLIGSVALALAAFAVGQASQSADEADARAKAPGLTLLTEPVEQRALVAETVVRGTIAPTTSAVVPLTPPSGSLPIITRRPAEVGATLKAGAVAVEVAGRPVVVLPGSFPVYRDLHLGNSGPDVLQLEADLRDLGLRTGPVDGLLDARTGDALSRLWRSHGYELPTEPSVDQDGLPTVSPVVPRTELAFVAGMPVLLTAIRDASGGREGGSDGGEASAAEGPSIVLSSTELVASGPLPAGTEAPDTGSPVSIESDVSGQAVDATVSAIVASADSGGTPLSTVVAKPSASLPAEWADQSVRIIVHRKTVEDALVVPVSALSARSNGRTEIRLLSGGESRRIAVEVLLVADGYAAIRPEGGDVHAGDAAIVGIRR